MQPADDFNLVTELANPAAYLDEVVSRVEVIETHISWIFLTDQFAYKVKKPVHNHFVDYSTLERRHQFCLEEVRIDRRYAADLYLGVVPIGVGATGLIVSETAGESICEYAVKMRRFPSDALLAQQLLADRIEPRSIVELGERIAGFHLTACHATGNDLGETEHVLDEAIDNFDALFKSKFNTSADRDLLSELHDWTLRFWQTHQQAFEARKQQGFVRECHGDLHTGNIVHWKGTLTPFDGVEFNPRFRWIDVLSDVAFLAMDLIAKEREDLSRLLINAYLERTGDYDALDLLRWYIIYRALVRSKIADLVMTQHVSTSEPFAVARAERTAMLRVGKGASTPRLVRLWITHGLSGSGKSTAAEQVVLKQGAVRIRSDVERKRMFNMSVDSRPEGDAQVDALYSNQSSQQTYERLGQLAERVLKAGYSVIIDATFLKRYQRQSFCDLAERLKIPFSILQSSADRATLEQRLSNRRAVDRDPSDADVDVLQRQIDELEPLSEAEQEFISSP